MTIAQRTIAQLTATAQELLVSEVRIGLIYTYVRLSNGYAGIGWTDHRSSRLCSHGREAGTLAGRRASELLAMLGEDDSSLHRSLGLATANALVASDKPQATIDTEILTLLNIHADERVAMVGYFGPVIPKIEAIGCQLDVIELKTDIPGTLDPIAGKAALAACDVAIITGTSMVTNTLDELLDVIENARAVAILGPSTLMCPAAFVGTPVTHLAGSLIQHPEVAAQVISEGGGTKALHSSLQFVTLTL